MTRGEKVIKFIQSFCRVPEGAHVGKNIVLEDFQKEFILAVYDNPYRTREAILSMARKNGKTSLIACLLLVHLVGTEAIQNSQIASGAMSKDNAGLVFKLAVKMINLNPDLKRLIRIVPSLKQLYGLPMNVEYQALAKDGRTNMGGSPVLLILDETGQVSGSQDDFIDAVITSQGAHNNPLRLVISTQAANDSDLLSIWIDDALTGKDPQKVCRVYTASNDLDLLDETGWHAANPALGKFRSLDDMRQMAEQATRMPSFENTFRNLFLNQRIAVHSSFISKGAWLACDGEPCPIEECEEIYGGLDLSGKTDLTAFILYGRKGDEWNTYSYFWTPEKGLFDRAKRDRAPYDVWVNMGLIRAVSGASIDYEAVARDMVEICSGVEVIAIAYDRWRIDILKKELERLGVDLPLSEWGQGFKDMAPAVDALEQVILNEKLRHGGNPVLTMCMNNAAIVRSPANDRKLDKSKSTSRIDGAVALAMAAGVADRMHQPLIDIDDIINNALIL